MGTRSYGGFAARNTQGSKIEAGFLGLFFAQEEGFLHFEGTRKSLRKRPSPRRFHRVGALEQSRSKRTSFEPLE